MDGAGADAAARAPDEQGLAFGGAVAAMGGGHVESEGAVLEEAGGGRVDAQGQYGRVGPGEVGWDFGDEGYFQDDVSLEAGVLVDAAWKRVRDADDAVARLEVLDAGADFFDEAGDVGGVDGDGFGLDDEFVCFGFVIGRVADDVDGVLLFHQPGCGVLGSLVCREWLAECKTAVWSTWKISISLIVKAFTDVDSIDKGHPHLHR